jgi:hypothetical protein
VLQIRFLIEKKEITTNTIKKGGVLTVGKTRPPSLFTQTFEAFLHPPALSTF